MDAPRHVQDTGARWFGELDGDVRVRHEQRRVVVDYSSNGRHGHPREARRRRRRNALSRPLLLAPPFLPPPPPSIGGSPHRTLSLSFLTSIDGSADLSFSPPFSMAGGWSRRKGETWWLGPGGIEALDWVWSDWVCDL